MRTFISFVVAFAAIAQVSAEQRSDAILIQGNPAGTQTVKTDPAGITHVEYSYNDRGRGDHIAATWTLDAAGVPIKYDGTRQRLHESASRGTIRTQGRQGELEKSLRKGRTGNQRRGVLCSGESRRPNFSVCWRALC